MVDNVTFAVTGAREVGIRFENFPENLRGKLVTRITALTRSLEGRIGGAMHSRTGELRSHLKGRVFNDKGGVRGLVSVGGDVNDIRKAGALEYGAHATITVRAHETKLDHAWAEKLRAPITVMVEAHQRHLNITAQRFIRDPTAAMRPEVEAAIQEAVAEAVAEANA